MYISTINWPQDETDKIKIYLVFLVDVMKALEISFPSDLGDPLQCATEYLDGKITRADYEKCAGLCWKYIDNCNGVRDFSDKNILKARLGILLTSATKNTNAMGENLAWFFEVLEFLGASLDVPVNMMKQHFDFNS